MAEDYPTASPPALLVDGKVFDPVCFLNDWGQSPPEESGDGVSFYPLEGCRIGEIAVTPNEKTPDAKFVGASYAEDFYDHEADEVYTSNGYIAYRYVGDYNGQKAMIVAENGGGSGIFTTLAFYKLDDHKMDDGATVKVLRQIKTIAGGDRCMGGMHEAKITDKGLVYSQNATAYDMLFLAGNPERPFLQEPVIDKVQSCALCCYAHAHFDSDGFTGMTLNRENLSNLQPDEDGQDSPQGCIDGLVKMNLEYGDGVFDVEGTESFIREIEHTCLGRMEGE